MSYRLYAFPSQVLRLEEYGLHAAYAITALLRQYCRASHVNLFKKTNLERWADEYKSIIVTRGKSRLELERIKDALDISETMSSASIPWIEWNDKKRDNALTCIVAIIPSKLYDVDTIKSADSAVPIYVPRDNSWNVQYTMNHSLYELVHIIQMSPSAL